MQVHPVIIQEFGIGLDFYRMYNNVITRWFNHVSYMLLSSWPLKIFLKDLISFVHFFCLFCFSAGIQVYILAFTAGGFLNIALVTVLPELLQEERPAQSCAQLLCLLLGTFTMATVATTCWRTGILQFSLPSCLMFKGLWCPYACRGELVNFPSSWLGIIFFFLPSVEKCLNFCFFHIDCRCNVVMCSAWIGSPERVILDYFLSFLSFK